VKQLRNPLLAGGLSAIVPGTGQIYNQDVIKGWIICILFFFLLGTFLGSVLIWGFAIVDAYLSAQKINRGDKKLKLERNKTFATVSSIICGWGQIYNGQLFKGGPMLACFIFLAPTGIGLLFMWVYGALDAYFTAEKINRGELETPFIKTLIAHRLDDLHHLLEGGETKELPEPANSENLLRLKQKAELAIKRKDYRGALTHTAYAFQSGGENDPALYRTTGKIYMELGNYGFSSLEFIRLLELGDRNIDVYNNLGLAILRYSGGAIREDFLCQAGLCLEKALFQDKECYQAQINRINLLILKKNFIEAGKECKILLEKTPGDWKVKHCMGLISLEEGKIFEAKEIFQEIIRKNPEALESKIALARIYEEEKDEKEALSIYKEVACRKAPEKTIRGVTFRIKRLNSPERKILRMIFGKK